MNTEKKNSSPMDVEDLILNTLGNATRREILKLIKKNPNITYTEIMKAMNLDTGTLNYHLSKMSEFITKTDNKYQLSKLGKVAIETIDFLHSQTQLSKEHAYFLFSNFVLLRLGDIFLALIRPRLAFKRIIESKISNYFPLALSIFILTYFLSFLIVLIRGLSSTFALVSNMTTLLLLVLFLPFLIVKTVETLWHNKKSYLDVATLLMISYTPNFVFNLSYVVVQLPILVDLKTSVTAQLSSIVFYDLSLFDWVNLLISLILLIWIIYLFFTSLSVYFDLTRGQALVILLFSGFLYFVVEAIILTILLLFSLLFFA